MTSIKQSRFVKNRKSIALNLILFAVLYLAITFNKEFIRPVCGHRPILGIITSSFSNIMAAYVISLFPLTHILTKHIVRQTARMVIYLAATTVFILPTIEEYESFVSVSKTYDIYDIMASGLGALAAVGTYELFFARRLKKYKYARIMTDA